MEDELITTIMGGHETTASLLSFLIYLLIVHPDKKKLVVDELRNIRKDSTAPCNEDGTVQWTYEELQRMDYLHCVVKEALRLYPRYEKKGDAVSTSPIPNPILRHPALRYSTVDRPPTSY